MANYVYQQIICSKDFLEKYLVDYFPFCKEEKMEPPYISFNKLLGVSNLNDYREKYGQYIYYGDGFSYKKQENGTYLVKFTTRWDYPIAAIRQAILLDHTVEWYAIEENCIYVSHFYWSHGVQESVNVLDDTFGEWSWDRYEFEETLDSCDHLIWYYLLEHKNKWQAWSSELELPRFFSE